MSEQQLPLFVPPQYSEVLSYLQNVCGYKQRKAEDFISENIPQLLDPNYEDNRVIEVINA